MCPLQTLLWTLLPEARIRGVALRSSFCDRSGMALQRALQQCRPSLWKQQQQQLCIRSLGCRPASVQRVAGLPKQEPRHVTLTCYSTNPSQRRRLFDQGALDIPPGMHHAPCLVCNLMEALTTPQHRVQETQQQTCSQLFQWWRQQPDCRWQMLWLPPSRAAGPALGGRMPYNKPLPRSNPGVPSAHQQHMSSMSSGT